MRDSDGWRINGVKPFATLVDKAHVLLAVAVTDPHKPARGSPKRSTQGLDKSWKR